MSKLFASNYQARIKNTNYKCVQSWIIKKIFTSWQNPFDLRMIVASNAQVAIDGISTMLKRIWLRLIWSWIICLRLDSGSLKIGLKYTTFLRSFLRGQLIAGFKRSMKRIIVSTRAHCEPRASILFSLSVIMRLFFDTDTIKSKISKQSAPPMKISNSLCREVIQKLLTK